MSLDTLRDLLPDYAKDTRLNLGSLANETILSDQQKYGAYLASAIASGNAAVIKHIAAEATTKLTPEAYTAAKAAAGIMAMNNIYYRFTHLVSEAAYETMPAKLRMHIIGKPGVDKLDFEFWCTVISSINGCGSCMDSHNAVVRQEGMSAEQVQAGIRIAAVVFSASAIMTAEEAINA